MALGPTFNKYLPYISLGVACAAFMFQTTVLYPWHHELDGAFHTMKKEQSRMLTEFHELKLKRLDDLEKKVLGVEKKQLVDGVNVEASSPLRR